jgi:DNA-binding transcriptional MerR regulator
MARKPNVLAAAFTSGEVERLSGLSKHMVDYLCRHGLIRPSMSPQRGYGKRRRFGFADILLARSLHALLASGVTVLTMRQALQTLREKLHIEAAQALRDKRIAIIDDAAYFSLPHQAPVELTKHGQMAFSFVLDIAQLGKRAESMRKARQIAIAERLRKAFDMRRRRIA